jgi:hypothetical protein
MEWMDDFNAAELSRADRVWVRSIHIASEADEDDWLAIDAEVVGYARRIYRSVLKVDMSRDDEPFLIDSQCSCSAGHACLHVAATLQKLSALAGGAEPAAPPATAEPAVSPAVHNWLAQIRADLAGTTPAKSAAPLNTRSLAYCISKAESYSNGPDRYQFTLRVANRNKNGSVRIDPSTVSPNLARPPKYLDDGDETLVGRCQALARKQHRFMNDMQLAGEGWAPILDGALEKEALYFSPGTASYRDKHAFRPLGAGPDLPGRPDWEILNDGSARPVIGLPRDGLVVLPTLPRRYIDPVQFTLGRITCDFPPELLDRWTGGPLVPAADVDAVTEVLAALPTAKPLPSPQAATAELRGGVPPQPHLRITRLRVGVFRREIIAGLVHFRYEGSPVVWPLDHSNPARISWKEGEKRIVLQRDVAAEKAALAMLHDLDLAPLRNLFSAADLDETTRHAVVPAFGGDSRGSAWTVVVADPDFNRLPEHGWTIVIDPGLGLEIHDLQDFFPEIHADPDHGIDWFRFEVTGEFQGKRFSLIPQIAAAIRGGWLDALPYEEDVTEGQTEDEAAKEEARFEGYDPDLDDWDDDFEEDFEPPKPRLPPYFIIPCDNPADGSLRFPAARFIEICRQVAHFFQNDGHDGNGPLRIDRLAAAGVADSLAIDASETTRALARLGRNLRDIHSLPPAELPATVRAELRPYQQDGYRWLQFLARHGLHGILADDMGLGKTLQTLAHLAAEHAASPGKPSLVIAPTSVVPNWAAEAAKFVPSLKVLTLHGAARASAFKDIAGADLVFTSYPLLGRDFGELAKHDWHVLVLDEAQYIKNPKALAAQCACDLKAAHRLCLSGTPMENHLGELWSLMRFLMPGFLGDEKSFNTRLRRPIERDRSSDAQLALNRRVSPLILRRTKDQVATELPAKTEIIHHVDLTKQQTDLYESVRAAMDKRVRDAIADKGLAKSHIIVLDALLKLRQICCHPRLLRNEAAQKVAGSAKLDHLTEELLPTLLEEGRRILLFSQFTSMLALIEAHLEKEKIPFLKLTGQTKDRAALVEKFQGGEVPVFLISLKAGGTGLNLTAADTVIHFDPWWNPAAENQATDRAHRIGQTKPVFVHKLVCRGTIEDRILELQMHKSALVEALLSEETTKLKIDPETLSHLLAPLD